MDIKRISPYPDHCTVTLDIPWDVAEAVVSAGPTLISNLRDVVKQHRQSVDENERLNKLRDKDADSPQQEWQAMAEVADVRIRQLMSDEDLSFAQAISKTAKEHHFPPSSMRALIESYRINHKEKLAKSRAVEIIRLYFKGVSNRIIADHLNTNVRTVQRCLAEHKDIIKFARNQIIAEKPELKRETRKEQTARYIHRNAEIVEQHLQGVSSYRLTKLFKLNIRTIQRILKTCETTTSSLDYDLRIEKRKENHRKLGIQLYRHYRRNQPNRKEVRIAHKKLAEKFSGTYDTGPDLPCDYVGHLITVRRTKVKKYVKIRRLKTIIRLREGGHTHIAISAHLRISVQTVSNILREHKASQIQGDAS